MKPKSGVYTSYHQGCHGLPMINVKWSPYWPQIRDRYAGSDDHEFGDDGPFWEWADREADSTHEGPFERADQFTREHGWELATEDAANLWPDYTTVMVDEKKWFPEFPPGCQHRFTGNKVPRRKQLVTISGEGRCGGWLVVHGLPDVDDWDAIQLGQWWQYERWVRAIVDDLDYQYVWNLHVNVYEQLTEGLIL